MTENLQKRAEAFSALFSGSMHAHGKYDVNEANQTGEKVGGNAKTVLIAKDIDQIEYMLERWDKHLNGKVGLGVIPILQEGTAWFGAIDVDRYDIDLGALAKQADKLPLVLCRTKSGGAHLYIFGSEPLPAQVLRDKLASIATSLGFQGSEVFPKQSKLVNDRDVGSWINMPYFDGDRTMRYAVNPSNGSAMSIDEFLEFATSKRITAKKLAKLKIHTPEDPLPNGPPCLNHLCRIGFPAGTFNNSLFSMGVYARQAFPDDWEKVVDKYNVDYMGPGSSAEVQNIIKQLSKKKYFYKCTDQPLVQYCDKRICSVMEYGIGGNEELPYELGTLIKIDSKPPTWFIDVDGGRLELSTEELLDQRKFRKLCVERINKFPRMLKTTTYENMVRNRLEGMEVVEAPDDAGPHGQLMAWVDAFFNRPKGRTRDDVFAGQHVIERGRILFRGRDLLTFLERQRFRDLSDRQIWAVLQTNGARHHQYHHKGKCLRCWSLPDLEEADIALDPGTLQDKETEF